MFDAHPLNGADNFGAINCSLTLAINSIILEFMVNISGSSGRKFDGVYIVRTIDQRQVSGTTMILPVDIYTLNLSVLTSMGFQYANFTKTVNISLSNYSASTATTATTAAAAVSTSTPSPTPTSTVAHGKLRESYMYVSYMLHV